MLAGRYINSALGTIAVRCKGAGVVFDFGVFVNEVGSRSNLDGTTSFITTAPGINGLEYVVGTNGNRRGLILRDNQHEYVYLENWLGCPPCDL
jgi:hypothetical protein